jgi:hypothetical protein
MIQTVNVVDRVPRDQAAQERPPAGPSSPETTSRPNTSGDAEGGDRQQGRRRLERQRGLLRRAGDLHRVSPPVAAVSNVTCRRAIFAGSGALGDVRTRDADRRQAAESTAASTGTRGLGSVHVEPSAAREAGAAVAARPLDVQPRTRRTGVGWVG